MKIQVLGCGPSAGVPMLGSVWGACDPKNPKNRRRRGSLMIERRDTRLLIDTAVDMREQCLDAGIDLIHGVLYTHSHADHTHGIDDLRAFNFSKGGPIDVYGNAVTLLEIKRRFEYAFGPIKYNAPWHRPSLIAHEINGPFEIGNLSIIPFEQIHGKSLSVGYRFGSVAYSTDVNRLPESAFECLNKLDCWFVACLGYSPSESHANLEKTLLWIKRVAPKRAILTYMANELDYEMLRKQLPRGVEPAFDGMIVEIEG